MADNTHSFFSELKRRNVYRVGIAYVVVAWLALQALDIVVPIMRAPEWISQLVLILIVIGLPFALIFAWAFEMTPEGLKLEKDVDRENSITHATGHRINRLTTGILVLAVGILLADKFVLNDAAEDTVAKVETPAETISTAPSIAVLPFVNMSADASSAYFSDGLADTLLHMLAQIRELRVAARTSSFQFRNQNTDITEIARQLNVNNILEGSVQRSGNKIRVTAQLIEAKTGFHLWSGNYDRDLDDVFGIQDEIAGEVVAALKISLLGESAERLTQRETENIDAYTQYLLGINDLATYSFDSLPRAEQYFREAVQLDPSYVLAWARLGDTYLHMQYTGIGSSHTMLENARDAASRALDIDNEHAPALAILGAAQARLGNTELADQLLLRAIGNEPNDTTAKSYYTDFLLDQLRPEESLTQLDEILALDPLSMSTHNRRASLLSALGRDDEALKHMRRIVEINPASPVGYYREAMFDYSRGRWAKAMAGTIAALKVDAGDPELPMLAADYYLALEMPAEARRWHSRAAEVDPEHAVSLVAPLVMQLYDGTVSAGSVQLALQLLANGIDDRQGSHEFILRTIWSVAEQDNTHADALALIEDYFPQYFVEQPDWRNDDRMLAYIVGSIMLQAGETEQGTLILEELLRRCSRTNAIFGQEFLSIRVNAALGNKQQALAQLRAYDKTRRHMEVWPVVLRNSPGLDLIRDEPEFIELIADLERNAAEQRMLLPDFLATE